MGVASNDLTFYGSLMACKRQLVPIYFVQKDVHEVAHVPLMATASEQVLQPVQIVVHGAHGLGISLILHVECIYSLRGGVSRGVV